MLYPPNTEFLEHSVLNQLCQRRGLGLYGIIVKKDTIVATVMSNLGFFLMAKKQNLHVEQTKVGDRYVLERMKEIGASLGGEQSGHVIFLDENTTGDGLLSALHLLQVMVETGKPLSQLAQIMEVLRWYPFSIFPGLLGNRPR